MARNNGSTTTVVTSVFCPIYYLDVGKGQCQLQSRVVSQNLEFCCAKECRSSWRFCIACLRQGYKGRDNLATNFTKGLCEFHEARGPTARRSENEDTLNVIEVTSRAKKKSHKVVGEVLEVPCDKIRPFKDQPRTYFDPIKLVNLQASIKARGQIQPALVKLLSGDPDHDFELIEGQRRWHACTSLGIPLRVEVRKVKDLEDQFEQSIIANFGREDHTPLEKARGVDRLRKNGRTWEYIADCFGWAVPTCVNYHKLLKLHLTIQVRLEHSLPEDKRLPISVAFSLTDLPVAEQLKALEKIDKEGLNVNQARELIRRHGEGVGVHVGGERSPYKDFMILRNYLRKIQEDASRFIGMNSVEMKELFKSRDSEDLPVTISQVESAIRTLSAIKSVLAKIGRK